MFKYFCLFLESLFNADAVLFFNIVAGDVGGVVGVDVVCNVVNDNVVAVVTVAAVDIAVVDVIATNVCGVVRGVFGVIGGVIADPKFVLRFVFMTAI